jgi:hypothetical protein
MPKETPKRRDLTGPKMILSNKNVSMIKKIVTKVCFLMEIHFLNTIRANKPQDSSHWLIIPTPHHFSTSVTFTILLLKILFRRLVGTTIRL